MPWCPKCKCEYREGFEICADCNSILVAEIGEKTEKLQENDKEMYLTNVCDEVEANILETLMNSCGIPILKKYPGAGGYLSIYMGTTYSGIDIYVASKSYEAAKELLDIKNENEIELEEESPKGIDDENAFKDEEVKIHRKRAFRTWIILLYFIPGLAFLAVRLLVVLWRVLFN